MDDSFYVKKLDHEFHPNDPHRPERRVFYVDVGNMSCETARRLMTEIMRKKGYND
jgi:adenosylmethionine-8-amino-7-oxononanoate aminotransferase